MHRKSIEAANTLKDDNVCMTSDKEEDDNDHHGSSSSTSEAGDKSSQGGSGTGECGPGGQEQDLRLPQDMSTHPHAQPPTINRTDPEQFRNNSIACLRAKVQYVTKDLKRKTRTIKNSFG